MLPIVPPPILLSAYRQGLFPMAERRSDQDIFWVEPRERAIIPIGEFHCSRSLARTIRRDVFTIRVDSDFAGTVLECAAPRGRNASFFSILSNFHRFAERSTCTIGTRSVRHVS